jgi:hypothetical protein
MAGPGGREVGRISIRVLPDTSRFGPELKAYLETTERRMRLDLPVSLDQKDVAKVEAQLGLLTRDRSVNIDTDSMVSNISSVTSYGARRFQLLAGAVAGVTVAIGALVAALPAMLAIFGAPLIAAIAGWDGIKNAAKGLTDEVEHLKTVLSATFEAGLIPSFERLADLFPVLERGLAGIAGSVSGVFAALTGALTSEGGLARLDSIFANVKLFFDGIAPAMGPFVDSLLILADAGTKVAAAMTPEFVALFTEFNRQLQLMAANGDLQLGMEGIGHALYLVVAALGAVVLGGIVFIGAIERMGEVIHEFFTVTVPNAANTVVDFMFQLPFRIVEALASLPGQLASLGGQAASAFLGAIMGPFAAAIELGAQVAADIISAISGLAGELGSLGANAAGSFLDGLAGPFDEAIALAASTASTIAETISNALNMGSPSKVMIQLGEWTGEGLQIGMERSLAGVTGAALSLANAPIHASSVTRLVNETRPVASGPRKMVIESGRLILEGGDAMIEGYVREQLVAAIA